MDSVQQAAQLIVDALEWDWKPEAHVPSPIEAVMPAAQALADAGLLVETAAREHYAALDQLAPGDRIWLDGAWREVVATAIEDDTLHIFTGAGEHAIDFHAPAALLIRRAEP